MKRTKKKNKRNMKNKKKSYQKRNRMLLFICIVVIAFTCFIIGKREETILANGEAVSLSEIKNIIEEKQAKVNRYIVYGTHLNLEGEIEILSEVENAQIVLRKEGGEENVIDTTYETSNNLLSFSTLDKINEGIDLENLDICDYFLLLKISYLNGQEKYYSLENNSQYQEKIEYYTITKNNLNNKINIEFVNKNNISAFVLNVNKISKLPEDVYDVVIDPGHGGSDSGAISGIYREDEIVLDCSLELKKKLEDLGLKVLLTRDGTEGKQYDMYNIYDKDGRVTMANESGAKILVSLHLNSNESDFVDGGVEVYASPNMDYKLAMDLSDNIVHTANTTYSKMESFKEELGVYVRTIDVEKNLESFKGYKRNL